MKKHKFKTILTAAMIISLLCGCGKSISDTAETDAVRSYAPAARTGSAAPETEPPSRRAVNRSNDSPFSSAAVNADKTTDVKAPTESEHAEETAEESRDSQSSAEAYSVSFAQDEDEPVSNTVSESVEDSDRQLTCSLSVRCDTVLSNLPSLDPEKQDLIPENGVIFAESGVVFYEGESVFNVLVREMKRNKIHLEFSKTPVTGSAYIEGIGNLYEFDCGELSGWMYKVNGGFPMGGCSNYKLSDGDSIEWIYSCDLGEDIGGKGISQKER